MSQKVNFILSLVFSANKICSKNKIDEDFKNIFGSLGYPSDIVNKTISKTNAIMNRLKHHGPEKCIVYLRLQYFDKYVYFLESKNTCVAVILRIVHFIRKPLSEIYKDNTPDPKKKTM